MVSYTVKDLNSTWTEHFIRVALIKAPSTARASILGLMEHSMRELGSMTRCKAKENSSGVMDGSLKETGLTVRCTVTEL